VKKPPVIIASQKAVVKKVAAQLRERGHQVVELSDPELQRLLMALPDFQGPPKDIADLGGGFILPVYDPSQMIRR
jgi:hypothetical protein